MGIDGQHLSIGHARSCARDTQRPTGRAELARRHNAHAGGRSALSIAEMDSALAAEAHEDRHLVNANAGVGVAIERGDRQFALRREQSARTRGEYDDGRSGRRHIATRVAVPAIDLGKGRRCQQAERQANANKQRLHGMLFLPTRERPKRF